MFVWPSADISVSNSCQPQESKAPQVSETITHIGRLYVGWHKVLAGISDYREMIKLHGNQVQEMAVRG